MSLLEVVLKVVAAVLLGMGSLLIVRALYLSDTLDASSAEPTRPASQPAAKADYPKAA